MIYRGYDITKDGGFYTWTDERGFTHTGQIDGKGGFKTEDEAMNSIDAYKRNMRNTAA